MVRRPVCFAAAAALIGGLAVWAPPVAAETLPALSVGDASIVEADSGSLLLKVPVDLSSPSATTVTVKWSVTPADGASTADVRAAKGTLTFLPPVTNKSVNVRVYGDGVVEDGESARITLASPVGATLADGSGTVSITDDDAVAPSAGIEASLGSVTATEADGGLHSASIPITLSDPAPAPVAFSYQVDCSSSATSGGDYTMTSLATVKFRAGQQTKYLPVNVRPDDNAELTEGVVQRLTVKSGVATLGSGEGGLTIRDDDGGLSVGDFERVNVAPDGAEATYPANPFYDCSPYAAIGETTISDDARFVAFTSDANNLVDDDTNGLVDVFRRDRVNGTTVRVSVHHDGSQVEAADLAGSHSGSSAAGVFPAISADGRFVAFSTGARLVPADTGNGADLYLYDAMSGAVELVSVTSSGSAADGHTGVYASVSSDGRFVAFSSDGVDLAAGDVEPATHFVAGSWESPQWPDVFVRDRLTGSTTLISAGAGATGAYGDMPSITPDGRHVAYRGSGAVVGGVEAQGVFVHDRVSESTERISLTSTGAPAENSSWPSISADGNVVAFVSKDAVVPGLPPAPPPQQASDGTLISTAVAHVFVRDRLAGTTEWIDGVGPSFTLDRQPHSPAVSADGRFVAFGCWCERVFDGASAGMGHQGVYVRDRSDGMTTQIDVLADGTVADGDSRGLGNRDWISGDGSYATFVSAAANLVANDLNNRADVFVQRLR